MEQMEEAIRERAYHLWIADGRPDGNPDAYWLNAQHEMLMHSVDGAVAADPVLVTTKPDKKAKVAGPRKRKRSAA
jgi:Protein of unknown function (DUF2934)